MRLMSIVTASVVLGATTGLSSMRASAQNCAAVGAAIPTCDYTYAPFGDCTATGSLAEANPWRFSSEYADDELGCVYYNYRHYEPTTGRWLGRDPIDEEGGVNLYGFVVDNPVLNYDKLGLDVTLTTGNKNASWLQFANRFLHQEICVDRWFWDEKSCCWRRKGRFCFSFGITGVGLGAPGGDWLGMDSIKGPGVLRGEVYLTDD